MAPLDWWIVGGLVTVLAAAALGTQRYAQSVGAFLVANRCGGRYLISMATAMAGLGVITDFIQGVFANVVFIVVMVFLLATFDWGHVSEALLQAPPEESLVHPMHLGDETHFNVWFYVISAIIMFLAITGAVFFGGAGSAIIGGLYWKRGTTAGAWGAMITGMTLALGGVWLAQWYEDFPITGQEMTFIAIAASVAVYVGVSLLGPRGEADMDKLLHRGRYAPSDESSVDYRDAGTWAERLGISREFTRRDRVVTYVTIGWPVAWTLIFIAGTIYNLFVPVASETWLTFWHWWTWSVLATSIVIVAWFSIGGFRDVVYLLRHLRRRDNPLEDGRVQDPDRVRDS